MRARAKQRGTYSTDVAGGRPVLPAARTIEAIVEELLLWATLMPAFAARITGAAYFHPDQVTLYLKS